MSACLLSVLDNNKHSDSTKNVIIKCIILSLNNKNDHDIKREIPFEATY